MTRRKRFGLWFDIYESTIFQTTDNRIKSAYSLHKLYIHYYINYELIYYSYTTTESVITT